MIVENFVDLYNSYAKRQSWPRVLRLSDKRKKSISRALKDISDESDWKAIFEWISKDSFWNKVMDFDKCYRNERYLEFFEKSQQPQHDTTLLGFLKKQQEIADESANIR